MKHERLKRGVSVMTVKDGWVFMLTREMLQRLLTQTEGKEYAVIFVQSSQLVPRTQH